MDTLVVCPKCEAVNRVGLPRADQSQAVCGRCKTELPLQGGVQELSQSTLNILMNKSSRPVVVDFWAPWCGPCRSFAPVYQQAALDLAGKMVLTKLNTEAYPAAGDIYHIKGIPTLVVFVNASEVGRQSGAMPLPSLIEFLKRFHGRSSN